MNNFFCRLETLTLLRYLVSFFIFPVFTATAASSAEMVSGECSFYYRESVTKSLEKPIDLQWTFLPRTTEEFSSDDTAEKKVGIFNCSILKGNQFVVTVAVGNKTVTQARFDINAVHSSEFGFTGLHYVYGPKGEELQFICKKKIKSK